MFLHIKKVKYIKEYKVDVLFNNGKRGVADLTEALKGPVFEALKDESKFSMLKVDEELETISWDNGADLAPEYVYFQAFKNEKDLEPQFKQWGYIS